MTVAEIRAYHRMRKEGIKIWEIKWQQLKKKPV